MVAGKTFFNSLRWKQDRYQVFNLDTVFSNLRNLTRDLGLMKA